MKEWEKELYMYRLSPAPPKVKDLQEYIDLYLSEEDEKYFEWFLHYYEPILNTTAMGIVQRYAMQGHFEDIKEVCILGLLQALDEYPTDSGTPFLTYKTRIMWDEVHRYIRTMRTGLTISTDSEYKKVRKAMRIYNACKKQKNPDALKKISKAIGVKEDTASQILQGALCNQQFIDFYRQYADDDGEESREEICGDDTYEPLRTLVQKELTETLFSAYNALSYKEQEVIRIRTGVCPDCHRVQSPKYKSPTFYEIAITIGLSSAEAAKSIFRQGMKKMREKCRHYTLGY
ncbi:MAG: hypothetical protein IJF56_08140 [Clostridia bacterium]|nr:hypothetical protein [Clostridia bacterium]